MSAVHWGDDEATTTACHPDSMWTCGGCDTDMCNWCDGTANGTGLCWTCFNAEDDS